MMDNAAIVKALVKGLNWEDVDEICTRRKAPALGGHYSVVEFDANTAEAHFSVNIDLGGLAFVFILEPDPLGGRRPKSFPTLAAAQAAAEQDYRARIAAALHIDKIAALVEAGVAAEVQLRECGVKMVGPGASALADLRDALAAFRGTEDGAAP